jgi:starch phosphorylase
MVLADMASYIDTQDRISKDFTDKGLWSRKAIMNTAKSGKFSSDRTIAEYAKDIWHVQPMS